MKKNKKEIFLKLKKIRKDFIINIRDINIYYEKYF
jgi:hypothetical protein